MSAKRRPESQLTAATADQDDDTNDEPGRFAKADDSSLKGRKCVPSRKRGKRTERERRERGGRGWEKRKEGRRKKELEKAVEGC